MDGEYQFLILACGSLILQLAEFCHELANVAVF